MSVIRLKRLIGEEPSEAILIHCKRQKLDVEGSSSAESNKPDERVFKFVGTVTQKNDGDARVIESIIHQKVNPKIRILEGVQNLKKKRKETSKINRFKLVNSIRGIPTDVDDINDASTSDAHEDRLLNKYNIYDAEIEECDVRLPTSEEQIMCNDIPMNTKSSTDFVYDLYYIDGTAMDTFMGQTVEIECYPLQNEFLQTEGSDDDDVEKYYDEDDSNSESNWRNDYPDEWEVEDQNESDIYDVDNCVKKMANCLIDHDYDDQQHSSDEGSLDEDDERRFGRDYAKYKAKLIKELNEDDDDDDDENEDF